MLLLVMDFFIILLVLFFLDKEGRDWIGTLYQRCKSIVRSITLPTTVRPVNRCFDAWGPIVNVTPWGS